jgi:hypothetical protein
LFNEKEDDEESEADKGNKHTRDREQKKSMMTNRQKEKKIDKPLRFEIIFVQKKKENFFRQKATVET